MVDDDETTRFLLGEYVRRASGEAERAAGLRAAVEHLERGHFDALITDLQMPDGSGLELLSVVVERWPSMGRVMLTGYASPAVETRLAELGARLIVKPSSPAEIGAAIAAAITPSAL